MRTILWTVGMVSLAGCATVKMHRVHPDWNAEQAEVKRLAVVTQPLPDQNPQVGELFSLVARRYVNQKRNFLAKENRTQAEPLAANAGCPEGIEGILWIRPDLQRVKEGVEGSVFAQLFRCRDGQEIWAAEAGGSFPSHDERLVDVTRQYQAELGEGVGPYVAPAFHLLRPTLDTMPDTQLTEEEIGEKIELGE